MLNRPFMIFSVERADLSEEQNRHNTAYAESLLIDEDLDYYRIQGMYEGNTEESFIVFSEDSFDMIRGIAKEFDQDSILMSDRELGAELVYLDDGHSQHIGWFRKLPKGADLIGLQAYSIINNEVYVCS